ncbi:M20 family metallopeptidase [Pseudodesulfovibrio tunisiensis]|uniref:M20 family metallopeptidase n=1 Tax=Pseudodesulfovibrio tunisiensis TaxID=463192 RepID=UPI001FB22DC3|nr:M20 family metallopeptidase [Pseudodesulfovibrio tunisiensis]
MERIEKYLLDNESGMFDLLERLVRINSHTANKAGVDRVADAVQAELEGMGLLVRRIENDEVGDYLVAETPERANGGGAMLCGHMDTVFPPEMGFDCFVRENGLIKGPGVYDMKSGIVCGIYALKALDAAGLLKGRSVAFVLNSDEETGSIRSRHTIIEEAEKSDFCFVMEGAELNGEVVTGRKGRTTFSLEVQGRPCHAGACPLPKSSAVMELAHRILELEALNDPDAGTSLNVGVIEGGVGVNTVPAQARAMVEFRFVEERLGEELWAKVERLAASPVTPGVTGRVERLAGRPSMQTSQAIMDLYAVVQETADRLGLSVDNVFRGGGSDANFVSRTGIPVLDGLGPAGDHCHTPDEYMVESSMVERTLLTAVALHRAFERFGG